jgi:hypothetical protein
MKNVYQTLLLVKHLLKIPSTANVAFESERVLDEDASHWCAMLTEMEKQLKSTLIC